VATASISGVGVVLVNADGLTLYSAAQEMHGAIACTGDCVKFWVPATGSLAGAPAAERAALGTIKRPDTGAEQLTYHGAPLYTFVEDHSSGQATGNGVSDAFAGHHFTWHAVVVSAAAKTPTTSTSTSSAGYPVY
jgi:predicted lipoprotein with Yx(FWY)xxD motif